jgi:hypothetical protein
MQHIFKGRYSSTLLLVLLLLVAIVAVAGCKGSTGDTGAQGPQGPQGMSGPTGSTGPQGPHGTFADSNCTDCHHMDTMAITSGLAMQPSANGGKALAPGATAAAGTTVTLPAVSTFTYVSSGVTVTVTAAGYYWQYMAGLPSTLSSPASSPTATITIPTGLNYRSELVNFALLPGTAQDNTRYQVVPVDSYAKELATNSEYMLTVFGSDGNVYFDIIKVTASDAVTDQVKYAPIYTTGLTNVPVHIPVLVTAQTNSFLTPWTLQVPSGSTAALDSTTIASPYFVPDTAGTYTVTDGNNVPVTVIAGKWLGVETATTGTFPNASVILSTAAQGLGCGVCHSSSQYGISIWNNTLTSVTNAPDKFTPWAGTGHSERFAENLNLASYTPSSTCFACHTVGWVNPATFNTTTAFPYGDPANNGFEDAPGYSTWLASLATATANPTNFATFQASFPALAQLSNIQCENCHGPQTSNAHTPNITPALSKSSVAGAPRISAASPVCGNCHGDPTHHGRFEEWQQSSTGHASYTVAQRAVGATAYDCSPCHSAQGNIAFQKQLVAGNPLRIVPSTFVLKASNVEPQTCVVCHDPHNVGTVAQAGYAPAGITTDADTRLDIQMVAAGLTAGNTPRLPTGFTATGVGKGAQCMICHNLRDGSLGSTNASGAAVAPAGLAVPIAANSYLHEDDDPVFGQVPRPTEFIGGSITFYSFPVAVTPAGTTISTNMTVTTGYGTPHDNPAADVLMGHNAYFVGSSGGDQSLFRSPHSVIQDTCVTCHMEKSPPPAQFALAYDGTNHTFKANMDICNDCHGIDNGLAPVLQATTQQQMAQVANSLTAVINALAPKTWYLTSAGTLTTNTAGGSAWSFSSVQLPATSTAPVAIAGHGGTWNVNLTSGSTSTTITGVTIQTLIPPSLNNVTVLPGTPANFYPYSDESTGFVISKTIWNYTLILNDQSLGIHNPSFTQNVLSATNTALGNLLSNYQNQQD